MESLRVRYPQFGGPSRVIRALVKRHLARIEKELRRQSVPTMANTLPVIPQSEILSQMEIESD